MQMSGTKAHDKVDVHTTNKRAWCIAIALIVAVLTITALMTSRSSFDMAITTKAHVKGRCAIQAHNQRSTNCQPRRTYKSASART